MTKIDIISGFLGAGKTTLIKKLLAEAPGSFVYKEAVLDELSADEEHYLTRISLFCGKKERQ